MCALNNGPPIITWMPVMIITPQQAHQMQQAQLAQQGLHPQSARWAQHTQQTRDGPNNLAIQCSQQAQQAQLEPLVPHAQLRQWAQHAQSDQQLQHVQQTQGMAQRSHPLACDSVAVVPMGVPVAPFPMVPAPADGARVRTRARRRAAGVQVAKNGGGKEGGKGGSTGAGDQGSAHDGDAEANEIVPSEGSHGHPDFCGKPCCHFHRAKGCRNGEACPDCHICWPSVGSRGHPMLCKQPCKYYLRARGCREGVECPCCHLCFWSRVIDRMGQPDEPDAALANESSPAAFHSARPSSYPGPPLH